MADGEALAAIDGKDVDIDNTKTDTCAHITFGCRRGLGRIPALLQAAMHAQHPLPWLALPVASVNAVMVTP